MQNTLENIHWKSLCPWLLLIDSLRVAFRVRVLFLAFVALLFVLVVNYLIVVVLGGPIESVAGIPIGELKIAPELPPLDTTGATGGVFFPWLQFVFPVVLLGVGSWGWLASLSLVLFVLLQVVVWAAFGGAICRISALALTRGEAPNLSHALKFAVRNYSGIVSAALMTLAGILLASLPLVILGLVMRIAWLGYIAALIWPIALLIGIGVTLLAVGLAIGFPLMWSAVAVEETDAFDAISRAYAYVFQRPLRLLWYVVVAFGLGWIGGLAVSLVLGWTLSITEVAVSWGRGDGEISGRQLAIIEFWNVGLSLFRIAYYYAYFWSAAVGIYLLLRRDIDSVQLDEVIVEPMETYTPSPLVAAGAEAETQPASN